MIDTREQLPLKFRIEGQLKEVEVRGLPFADYWCEVNGKELPVVLERKSLGDLYGTMTAGYERFKRSMEKAKAVEAKMILLIEGSLRTVHEGYSHSEFDGSSMLKKLATLHVKYDLEYHFFNDREEMARFIVETFGAIERCYTKEKV